MWIPLLFIGAIVALVKYSVDKKKPVDPDSDIPEHLRNLEPMIIKRSAPKKAIAKKPADTDADIPAHLRDFEPEVISRSDPRNTGSTDDGPFARTRPPSKDDKELAKL